MVSVRSARWLPFNVLTAVTLWCVIGCRNETVDVAEQQAGPAASVNQETTGEKCRKKLAAAIRRLNPESLALQASPERSINGLNAWIASCAADQLDALQVGEETLGLLDSNARVTAGRFTANDASYIRDCLLLRDLTTALWARVLPEEGGVGNDAARVLQMFDWLVRNVSLLPAEDDRVTVGLFDILLTGRGTPEDRAWIFVEALRQQQIHNCFIVRTDAAAANDGSLLDTAEWLVAVVLENGSMLFDPVAGVPVPAEGRINLKSPAPIGLAQLKQHSRWTSSSVQIVAQASAFAPRMLVLQNLLAAEDSAVFYEELSGGVSQITPLIDLVVLAGDGLWTRESVSVWNYPEQQVVASSSLNEQDQQSYTQMMRPFDAPFERKVLENESIAELTTVPEELPEEERRRLTEQRLMENFMKMNQSSEDMFGRPSQRLLKTRILQIMGRTDTTVIQQLQQIRIAGMQEVIRIAVPGELQQQQGWPPVMTIPFPELIREVNLSSTGDSLYWTAMCQIDRGEVGAAIITLMNYRRQYPDARWKYPSLMNQAFALLVQDRTDDALAALTEADQADNPERLRVQMMIRSLSPQ